MRTKGVLGLSEVSPFSLIPPLVSRGHSKTQHVHSRSLWLQTENFQAKMSANPLPLCGTDLTWLVTVRGGSLPEVFKGRCVLST